MLRRLSQAMRNTDLNQCGIRWSRHLPTGNADDQDDEDEQCEGHTADELVSADGDVSS
ncbi:MAG: hypothetical protein Aurels2KO_01100 [Aureliella sp.]